MINNFFRGLDGWVHASHGFANASSVTDRIGNILEMTSGNTFRFREDGSGIEFTTTGRVNPFGYAYDELGYLYSVDCHTSPIYQLIRGADYPHFGKQPIGIGFGPSSEIKNQHGATALAGLEYYIAAQFPAEFQNSFYYGDAVKSKVYRSTMEMRGTTAYVTQQEDFIESKDPWFRPVDVKMGSDGALYIADFYNRIIGHYEVPLDHPGRDRERGRIWRIIYTGVEKHEIPSVQDWSNADLGELIKGLGHENLPLRTIIADQIVDRFSVQAIAPLKQAFVLSVSAEQQKQILWLLYRLNELTDDLLIDASKSADVSLRVHALRVMFEMEEISDDLLRVARKGLEESQPDITRASLLLLAKYPDVTHLSSIFSILKEVPKYDTHLKYVTRQCLRDHLRNDELFKEVTNHDFTAQEIQFLVDVAVGVETETSAGFLLNYLKSQSSKDIEKLIPLSFHSARYIANKDLDKLVMVVKKLAGTDLHLQYKLYSTISSAIDRRGTNNSKMIREWAISLAGTFLEQKQWSINQWEIVPMEQSVYKKNTWELREISAEKGLEATTILASGPHNNERQMSTMFSKDFVIPDKLSFQLVGSKYSSDNSDTHTNYVQLRLSETGEIVQEAFITHKDFREYINWDNTTVKGKKGYLVLVDGSTSHNRYIGIGVLSPTVIDLPFESPDKTAEQQIFAANVMGEYLQTSWEPTLKKMFLSDYTDMYARAVAAKALLSISPQNMANIEKVMADEKTPSFLLESIVKLVGTVNNIKALDILRKSLSSHSYNIQQEIALVLSQSNLGIDKLLEASTSFEVSPRILLERQINEVFMSNASEKQISEYEKLVENVKKPSLEIQELINKRIKDFEPSRSAAIRGSDVFVEHCSSCHQINKKGSLIGPQLDGIGNWGVQALTEKILDPNRNVSKAFISYNLNLKDGTTRSGLFRREEGEVLVFADASGKEFAVIKSEIAEKKVIPFTLMPDNFSEVIEETDYFSLLNYLLSKN